MRPDSAIAHDPGLSSLDLQIAAGKVVATLSLSVADANLAARNEAGGLDSFVLRAIDLRADGVPLAGAIERRWTDRDAGATVRLIFDRAVGSRLIVRSEVPGRLAIGHRELVTIRRGNGQLVADRMIDAHSSTVNVDIERPPGDRRTIRMSVFASWAIFVVVLCLLIRHLTKSLSSWRQAGAVAACVKR